MVQSKYHGYLPVCSGGFDPPHSGHVAMLSSAYELTSRRVMVLVNSDAWLVAKKGKNFMDFSERKSIVEAMHMVDSVVSFDDSDGTCIAGLKQLRARFPNDKILFCNGGDRTQNNIPEMSVPGIEFEFGVGGEHKSNSSSALLNNWEHRVQERVWGTFRDLFKDNAVRVKELVIQPGQGISYQRHFRRMEYWIVSHGDCKIKYAKNDSDHYTIHSLTAGDEFKIDALAWHQVYNETDLPCHIIEVQYGQYSTEDDIERLSHYKPK